MLVTKLSAIIIDLIYDRCNIQKRSLGMIRVTQIRVPIGHTTLQLEEAIKKELGYKGDIKGRYNIVKQSLDARKGRELSYTYAIDVEILNEAKYIKRSKNATVSQTVSYSFPEHGNEEVKGRIVIVGCGPAGLFCGYMLAKEGYKPLIIERGEAVDDRKKTVDAFWNGGELNTESNVQFGEGGAGTFSDGKLNTLVKDSSGRNKKVLEIFVNAGADKEIMYVNKPHIGTDVLHEVVRNMRNDIIKYGGEVRFNTKLTDIFTKNGKVCAIEVNDNETIETDVVVLALGHSARDTFYMINDRDFEMIPKAFAVGLRIEHPQEMISQSQYHEHYKSLPPASYKLTYQSEKEKRGIYSFCMCPGGYVVNASSEKGRLAVNGMSYNKRDSDNANSAMIVTVTPDDFKIQGPLGGVEFQRQLEENAYNAGGGKVPVQLFGDYKENRKSTSYGSVKPLTKGANAFANLRDILPEYINRTMIEGIDAFDRNIKNFNMADAILSGVESRTSSPLRIVRDENFEANIKGVYPCGEGAGYAGGITSAAMDGIKVAEMIAKKFHS